MKLYLIHNLVFFPFEDNSGKKTKYISGSISGQLFLNDVYTEEEINVTHPKAIACKDLHEVCLIWGKQT